MFKNILFSEMKISKLIIIRQTCVKDAKVILSSMLKLSTHTHRD
jgi:hypothetical protein